MDTNQAFEKISVILGEAQEMITNANNGGQFDEVVFANHLKEIVKVCEECEFSHDPIDKELLLD